MTDIVEKADKVVKDWPNCPRCDSGETTVVPAHGEWTCEDCGCQWTPEERPDSSDEEDEIPAGITEMIEMVVEMGKNGRSVDTGIEQEADR